MRPGVAAPPLLALALALAPGRVRADARAQPESPAPCPDGVRVEGVDEVVTPLAAALRARGLDPEPPAGCAPLRAHVSAEGLRLRLVLEGADEVRIERTAASPEIAAIIVEAFVRADLTDPLLAPRAAPVLVDTPVAAAPPAPPPPAREAEARAPAAAVSLSASGRAPPGAGTEGPPRPGALAVTAGAEVISGGGARSLGAALAVCGRIGPLCAGGRLRLSADGFERPGKIRTRASDAEALATLEAPIALGRVLLRPGAGAGLGWVTRKRRTPVLDADSPLEAPTGLRLEARLGLSLPLGAGLSLDLGAGLGLAPLPGEDRLSRKTRAPTVARAGLGLGYRTP